MNGWKNYFSKFLPKEKDLEVLMMETSEGLQRILCT